MPLYTLAKFSCELMLIVHYGPTKVAISSLVYFPKTYEHTTEWLSLNHRFSLMSHALRRILLFTFTLFIMTCVCHSTGPCFVFERSRLQNQITLRLVFYSWQLLASLFIVHEYWRNSTSYIASCHPLILLLTNLRDREQWDLFSIQDLHTLLHCVSWLR